MKSRTQYTVLNLITSLAVQPLRVGIGFINRTIFISTLGITYLSLSGLLTSILSVLSLAELGVGAAMSYALYKPLANANKGKVTAYMQLFQKLYRLIGVAILVLGIILSFFLSYFLKGQEVTSEVLNIYYLFLINSVVSYFFVYKRTLIEADQKKYKVSVVDFAIFFVGNIIQIGLLLFTKNYYIYLLCTIAMTIISNVIISKVVDKEYPYILKGEKETITREEKSSFIKNMKGIVVSRVGEIIVHGTDNILISSFVGLNIVGVYSNYAYLLSIISGFMVMVLTSVRSSVANLVHTRNSSLENVLIFLKKYQFIVFMINFFGGIGIILFINPLITLWIGEEYLFNMNIVLLIVVNFFITNYRSVYSSLITVYGLNYEQNIKVISEIILNLLFSFVLLYITDLGIVAILVGTLLSSIITVIWYEPYSVFKYGLKYFDRALIKNTIAHYSGGIVILVGLYFIEVNYLSSLNLATGLMSRSIIYVVIFIIFSAVSYKNEGYRFIINIVRRLKRG